jgi:hypothetical protein
MNHATFEDLFRQFVTHFGGQTLPEGRNRSADFLFPEPNVVAELKTLQEDAKAQHDEKMKGLVHSWMARGLLIVFGRNVIRFERLNPVCQREWLSILQPPLESIIRDANRQIRSTKKTLNKPTAKGLLLIANDGNLLHTSPVDYMIMVSRLLQKKDAAGAPRFPEIRGAVYFSYRIASQKEGLPFWAPGVIEPRNDADLMQFQEELKRGWFSYLGGLTGQPVKEIRGL